MGVGVWWWFGHPKHRLVGVPLIKSHFLSRRVSVSHVISSGNHSDASVRVVNRTCTSEVHEFYDEALCRRDSSMQRLFVEPSCRGILPVVLLVSRLRPTTRRRSSQFCCSSLNKGFGRGQRPRASLSPFT